MMLYFLLPCGLLIHGSMDIRQQSIEEVVVLLAQVLQFGHTWGEVEVLLGLVLLEGGLCLVDICCEAVVGNQGQGFNLIVVSLQELFDRLRSTCVE